MGVQCLQQTCVKTLVERVASCYQENNYHCFTHACDVTISAFVLLTKFGGAEYLRPIDSLALVVTALMHDVGHPGKTNAFEKQAQSELVKAYGEVRHDLLIEVILLVLLVLLAEVMLVKLFELQQPLLLPLPLPVPLRDTTAVAASGLTIRCPRAVCRWVHTNGCIYTKRKTSSALPTAMCLRPPIFRKKSSCGLLSCWSM